MRYEYANHGKAFKEFIIMVNEIYKTRGKAITTKAPTEWIIIHQGGKIVSVKMENKSIVDFLGSITDSRLPLMQKNVYPLIRFDGQSLKPINRIFGQAYKTGGISFVFVSFKNGRYFAVT